MHKMKLYGKTNSNKAKYNDIIMMSKMNAPIHSCETPQIYYQSPKIWQKSLASSLGIYSLETMHDMDISTLFQYRLLLLIIFLIILPIFFCKTQTWSFLIFFKAWVKVIIKVFQYPLLLLIKKFIILSIFFCKTQTLSFIIFFKAWVKVIIKVIIKTWEKNR